MKLVHLPIDGQTDSVSLCPGEVHLWQGSLRSLPGCEQPIDLLVPEEQARAARFRVERIRQQFVIGRSSLRHLLSRYLDCAPQVVAIEYESNGKPVLSPPNHEIYFNLSHTEEMVLFAFSRHRLGVDVERMRAMENMQALVDRFFTPAECEAFRTLPEADRFRSFFQAWTRKESVLKAMGQGVQALDTLEVSFGPDQPPQLLRYGDASQPPTCWFLHDWEPEADYLACIAVQRGEGSCG